MADLTSTLQPSGDEVTTDSTSSGRRRLRVVPGIGIFVLVGIVLMALWPHGWLPDDPTAIDPVERFLPPAWAEGGLPEHVLGTDVLGRDILSQMVAGARASLIIVMGAALLSLVVGVTLGLLAGHFGGWLDSLIMRLVDVQLAFPVLVVIIAVVAVFGPSVTNLVFVLALASWASYARLLRGLVLGLKRKEFIDAAWAVGASDADIILRHYLPNTATSIVIFSTFEFARLLLVESALSFLGLGVQPPTPSWGRMISEARNYLFEAWWASALPGVLIVASVLAFNLLGDELRDHLDPTSRQP